MKRTEATVRMCLCVKVPPFHSGIHSHQRLSDFSQFYHARRWHCLWTRRHWRAFPRHHALDDCRRYAHIPRQDVTRLQSVPNYHRSECVSHLHNGRYRYPEEFSRRGFRHGSCKNYLYHDQRSLDPLLHQVLPAWKCNIWLNYSEFNNKWIFCCMSLSRNGHKFEVTFASPLHVSSPKYRNWFGRNLVYEMQNIYRN